MASERIVSIGFLTERDLVRLGAAFTKHIPVSEDDIFADLLSQLEHVEAVPCGDGISIVRSKDA